MDKQLIKLLDSPIDSDRSKAIKAIAQSEDAEYIPYLAAFYKTETNPELKELCAKAARFLKKQNMQGEWGGTGIAGDLPPEKPKRVEVSAGNEKRAASMLDRALNLSMTNQDDEARALVAKAYETNPNIRFDDYQRGLVATVMGDTPEGAFMALDEGAIVGKSKRKRKNSGEPREGAGWGTAFADLLIYATAVAATMIVTMLVGLQIARPYIMEAALTGSDTGFNASNGQSLVVMVEGLMNAGMGISIGYGIVTGIFSAIALVFSAFFIHIAATMIMGGEGTLSNLIHKVVPAYTILTVIGALIATVFTVILVQQMASGDLTTTTTQSGSRLSYSMEPSPVLGVINLISFVLGLVGWIIIVGRIASAYSFTWLRGCFAQIIASILMIMLSCGCVFVFSTIFAVGISSLIPLATMAR